ncbi:AMP-binding protein [Streptomyces sp. NPDC058807]|uniref:AMP-binding protein n=1 Tax=unclassified Streptomyces TaxID=2593676 RepID=UPI003698918D
MTTDQLTRTGAARPPRPAARPLAAGTLDGLFTATARHRPGAVAVHEGQQHLTYARADARSAQLATALLREGLQLGDPVIVHCSDHRQSVVAQLAVLKAGGVCVPVGRDASPRQREGTALLSGAHMVLCSLATRDRWQGRGPRLVLDAPALWRWVGALRADRSLPLSGPTDAAYLLTAAEGDGEPVGHLVDHRAWCLALAARTAQAGSAPPAVSLAEKATGTRTLSAMWWAFAAGSTLSARPSATALFDATTGHGPGAIVCGPEEYARALDHLGRTESYHRPRMTLLVGGPCSAGLAARHLELLPNTRLRAEFVPVDGVLPWTVREFTQESVAEPEGAVGAPLPDVRLTVMDALGRPLGTGRTGEICATGRPLPFDVIGGRGRIVPGGDGAALLRSGLTGRWRLDGTLEITPRTSRGRRHTILHPLDTVAAPNAL